jgi:hypothetical protein
LKWAKRKKERREKNVWMREELGSRPGSRPRVATTKREGTKKALSER